MKDSSTNINHLFGNRGSMGTTDPDMEPQTQDKSGVSKPKQKILITGGTGLVGSALTERLLAQGHTVYSLSRHPVETKDNLTGLPGDILESNLGLPIALDFDACYHLAALLRLGEDRDGRIWRTNVEGTKKVVDFCLRHNIPRLYFCSTAYTHGRNTYERSKEYSEEIILESEIPHKTIFKPSLIMPSAGQVNEQHFFKYFMLLIKFHRRAELIRRKIEGTLRLPVIVPVFRATGNPDGAINLVRVEDVADAMARITNEGTYWLTNPAPTKIRDICAWVGDFIMVRLEAHLEFKHMPLELAFERVTRAFLPYFKADDRFPSDILECPPITREYLEQCIKTILGY